MTLSTDGGTELSRRRILTLVEMGTRLWMASRMTRAIFLLWKISLLLDNLTDVDSQRTLIYTIYSERRSCTSWMNNLLHFRHLLLQDVKNLSPCLCLYLLPFRAEYILLCRPTIDQLHEVRSKYICNQNTYTL